MSKQKINQNDVVDFIYESNLIEDEPSGVAMDDAMVAWEYLIGKRKLGLSHVLKTHQLLMNRLRPDIAGQFRDCPVYIGGEIKKYWGKEVLASQVMDVCQEINEVTQVKSETSHKFKNAEEHCKRMHVQFENVHPFEDGNGRVGRIIYNWHRVRMGLPIHVIHSGIEQMDYYKWFKKDAYE